MVSPEGAFYSAEDADSEGEEGLFYLWRPEEFEEILEEDAELFCKLFDVESGGNYAEEASGKGTGLSILHLRKSFAEWTKECGIAECELKDSWEKARQKLFAFREKRIHPLKDDKILTDWNGLMIAALAKASYILENPLYLKKAEKAADFIWERLRDENGDLLKRYRMGEAGLSAHLDDYAFLTWGFLELYEASFEIKHLERALELNEKMLKKFWDRENGGFFFSADSPDLLVRNKQIYDGAIPSGNSIVALNLIRLARMTGNFDWEEKARQIARVFSKQLQSIPMGHTQFMCFLSFAFGPSSEIVVVGKEGATDSKEMLKIIQKHPFSNKVILFKSIEDSRISEIAKYTEGQSALDGKATVYVCKNRACELPCTDAGKLYEFLQEKMGGV